jgi:hypothetical protein
VDIVGVTTSAAGLVALTYGLIRAGQDGRGHAGALALMAGGVVILAGFSGWERRLSRQALVDLGLFASRLFTWGVILAAPPWFLGARRMARNSSRPPRITARFY